MTYDIENRDNFTMQDFRDNEMDRLYDELMDVLDNANMNADYIDSNDIENVLKDVAEDIGMVLFS